MKLGLLLISGIMYANMGNKSWCYVLPNTQEHCHAIDKADCDGVPAVYCIYDSREDCEKGKLYSDEYCKENK